MSLDIGDSRLRSICAERCADVGDPPCHELDRRELCVEPGENFDWKACADCLRDLGVKVPEPIDPAAAIRPLL